MLVKYKETGAYHLPHKKKKTMIIETKLFDLSFLQQMEDENFLIEVIELFIRDTNTDLGMMKQAYDVGDLETVYKTAHKLKSSAGMLQATHLFNQLEEIETIAKARDSSTQLAEMIRIAQYEFDRLKEALGLYLQKIQSPV